MDSSDLDNDGVLCGPSQEVHYIGSIPVDARHNSGDSVMCDKCEHKSVDSTPPSFLAQYPDSAGDANEASSHEELCGLESKLLVNQQTLTSMLEDLHQRHLCGEVSEEEMTLARTMIQESLAGISDALAEAQERRQGQVHSGQQVLSPRTDRLLEAEWQCLKNKRQLTNTLRQMRAKFWEIVDELFRGQVSLSEVERDIDVVVETVMNTLSRLCKIHAMIWKYRFCRFFRQWEPALTSLLLNVVGRTRR